MKALGEIEQALNLDDKGEVSLQSEYARALTPNLTPKPLALNRFYKIKKGVPPPHSFGKNAVQDQEGSISQF